MTCVEKEPRLYLFSGFRAPNGPLSGFPKTGEAKAAGKTAGQAPLEFRVFLSHSDEKVQSWPFFHATEPSALATKVVVGYEFSRTSILWRGVPKIVASCSSCSSDALFLALLDQDGYRDGYDLVGTRGAPLVLAA